MNKLTLTLIPNKINYVFSIEGKILKFKKNKKGLLETTFESEKPEIKLDVQTLPSELVEEKAGLHFIIFFFLSVLNIFNPSYPKRDIFEVNYSGNINISENPKVFLTFIRPIDSGKVLKPQNENSAIYFADNESNIYVLNKKAKRRRTIVNVFKALTMIATIIALIALLIIGLIQNI
ncbi:MAG: hypothetical protein PHX62_09020 [Bacilli bacterium]|jgi:hypothetical protein|nr:hypothetical protein [Bacilli bacterium]